MICPHCGKETVARVAWGGYELDLEHHLLIIAETTAKLTNAELQIMRTLLAAEGQVVDRKALIRPFSSSGNTNSLTIFICRLNWALCTQTGKKRIIAEYGKGYFLEPLQ